MSGFPNTPSRSSFGPTYRNRDGLPVRDPSSELDAGAVNLAMWQTAGAGRTVPKAVLAFTVEIVDVTPVLTVVYQGLAWDPDGRLPALEVGYQSEGVYLFEFAASYPDQRGVAVPWLPRFALPSVTNQPGFKSSAQVDGRSVTLRAFDAAGVPTDANMAVSVWG